MEQAALLRLQWQRQRAVLEQPRLERQLLVSFAQLADQRQEPELQQWRSQPAEQQQSVQRLRPQGSAALITTPADTRHRVQFHTATTRMMKAAFIFIITISYTIIQTSPSAPTGYRLTRQQLLYDLYVAFYDAARHKHKMSYVQKFEANLAENLNELCDDLLTRRYEAQPSKCFRGHLSQEARGIRRHVPRPHRASPLLPLYQPAV